MKSLIFIITLIILFSCQLVEDKLFISSPDTITVTHKRYYLPHKSPDTFEYKLVREQKSDSLLSFHYYTGADLSRQYNFNIKQGQFQLIQMTENPDDQLVLVDTFTVNLLNEPLKIFKYEIRFPPIDGAVGYLFNKKYGLVGYSAYAWGNKTIMTNWKKKDFEKEMKELLLVDSLKYLKRQDIVLPPLPGQPGKIKIVEDKEAIEYEEELEEK